MKAGEEFVCPHCGKDGFLRLRQEMSDDWSGKKEFLSCSCCGKFIAEYNRVDPAGAGDGKNDPLKSERAEKLLSLFGEDSFAEKKTLADAGNERRFCKDCSHLIRHPFHCRCSLYEKEVDPMGDCASFVPVKND